MRLPVSYPDLSRPSGCKILHFSYTVKNICSNVHYLSSSENMAGKKKNKKPYRPEFFSIDYKSGAVTTLPPYLQRKINFLSLGLSDFPEIDELLQPDVTTRLAGEVPSPLACEDIPEAHKFHSGNGTGYSFPARKVNDNWNHLKTNLGQRLALQFSTPVLCAAARLRFFCNVNFLFNGHCRDV